MLPAHRGCRGAGGRHREAGRLASVHRHAGGLAGDLRRNIDGERGGLSDGRAHRVGKDRVIGAPCIAGVQRGRGVAGAGGPWNICPDSGRPGANLPLHIRDWVAQRGCREGGGGSRILVHGVRLGHHHRREGARQVAPGWNENVGGRSTRGRGEAHMAETAAHDLSQIDRIHLRGGGAGLGIDNRHAECVLGVGQAGLEDVLAVQINARPVEVNGRRCG